VGHRGSTPLALAKSSDYDPDNGDAATDAVSDSVGERGGAEPHLVVESTQQPSLGYFAAAGAQINRPPPTLSWGKRPVLENGQGEHA